MSSNFKLMLRPPPHVEFLQGYPGIAPHGERKSALVQGTLEVRGNVKAKWVRVELRKIEILPGGGQNGTFSETIGERPITLWSSQQEEFTELGSKDFPFHINVPDAVPPSIALERGAAIKYELVASVMLKGKKSLFKRDPAPITTHTAPIVIEKYDLLQTWPIYSQPQSRQNSANGVTLIANFQHTAFGPGDVVPVEAILRADVPGTGVILRAYELTVRETLIFRSSPPPVQQHQHPHLHLHSQQPPRRTPAAQTRSNVISDQNVPVPVQLFPGSQHRCDLGCQIPLAQTNVSVRTARHIEVNYVVQVKAVLASNATVSVDLPVTITNWQRQASQDAISRIGFAPELVGLAANHSPSPGVNPTSQVSLFQATNPPNGLGNGHGNGSMLPGPHSNGAPSSTAGSTSIPERVSRRSTGAGDAQSPGRHTLGSTPGTIPGRTDDIDELGYIPAHVQQNLAQTLPNRQSHQGTTNNGASQGGSSGVGGGGGRGSDRAPSEPEREEYFGNVQPLNAGPPPAVPRPRSSSSRKSGVPAQQRFTIVNVDEPSDAGGSKPMSAEEEKRMLKEKYAKEEDRRRRRESDSARPAASTTTSTGAAGGGGWMSAEEEKKRLYNSARQAAAKTQVSAGYEAPAEPPIPPAPPVDSGAGGSSGGAGGSKPEKKEKSWPTAEEEKRRMFENARKAAQKTQHTAFEGHAPYEIGVGAGGDDGGVAHDEKGSGIPAFPQSGNGDGKNDNGAFVGGWAMSPGGPYSHAPFAASQPTPYSESEPWSSPPEPQPQPEARPAPQQWLSAADEKRMLFEKARAAAEHTQRRATTSSPPVDDANAPAASNSQSPYTSSGTSTYGTPSAASPYNSGSSYPNSGAYSSQFTASPTTTQPPSFLGGHTPAGNKTGSELFAAGLAAMGRESMYGSPKPSQTPPPMPGGRTATPPYGGGSQLGHGGSQLGHSVSLHGRGGSSHGHGASQLGHSVSVSHRFPSAAEEKQALAYRAAMQRVEQARAGEDANGSSANGSAYTPYGGPPPDNAEPSSPTVPSYDALYGGQAPPLTRPLSVQRRPPSSSGAASPPPRLTASPPPMPSSDLPPNFTPNPGPTASALSALEEKARLRKQYEEQDAAGGQSGLRASPPAVTPPPAQAPSYGLSAQEEKERMKRMYAEQDEALRTGERRATRDSATRGALPAPPGASRVASPPLPAPTVPGYESNGSGPPAFMGGFVNPATMQPLSAAEEKARLRAQYEAEANGHAYSNDDAGPPPPSFESHYGPPESEPSPVHAQVESLPPSGGLHRDPTISWGKRRATQTEEPPAMPRSGFVAPPPPPPLMPKPPATYIQETLALAEDTEGKNSGEWDRSRSVTPDLYDDEPRGTSPNQQIPAPPLPPKLPA